MQDKKPIEDAYAFIDFEASSLSKESWPVEVGLSWIESGEVQTWSSVIRKHEDWSMAAWSDQSAAIHCISKKEMAVSPFAETVARQMVSKIGSRILISDAPEYDQKWFDVLIATIDMAGHQVIKDYDHVTHKSFDERSIDFIYERLKRTRSPHRAGPDSARLANSWLAKA